MEDNGDNCPTCRHPDGIPPEHLALMRANAASPDVRARFAASMAAQRGGFAGQDAAATTALEVAPRPATEGFVALEQPAHQSAQPYPARPREALEPLAWSEHGVTQMRLHGHETADEAGLSRFSQLNVGSALTEVGPPQYLRDMFHAIEGVKNPATRAALAGVSLQPGVLTPPPEHEPLPEAPVKDEGTVTADEVESLDNLKGRAPIDIREGDWVPDDAKARFKGELPAIPPAVAKKLECSHVFFFWMKYTNYMIYEERAIYGPFARKRTDKEVEDLKKKGVDALTSGDYARFVRAKEAEFPWKNFDDLKGEALARAQKQCPPDCPPRVHIHLWEGMHGVKAPSEHDIFRQLPGQNKNDDVEQNEGPVKPGAKRKGWYVVVRVFWAVDVVWIAAVTVHCENGDSEEKEDEF